MVMVGQMAVSAASVAFVLAGGAEPACERRVLGETAASFMEALAARLQSIGVAGLVRVSRSEEGAEIYALAGSDVNVVVVSENGMLAEVRTVVASPTKAETDRQLTVAAFTVARLSGETESGVKARLYASLSARGNEAWTERWDDIAAVVTRGAARRLIKVLQGVCR
jgi:hypothetical protein